MEPIKLNLADETFGRTPAAIYLVKHLFERTPSRTNLARKCGRVLSSVRELVNDVMASHLLTDQLKRKSFNKLIELIHGDIIARCETLANDDAHAAALVQNILMGELRVQKARAVKACHLHSQVQRHTPEGKSVPIVKACQYLGEESNAERITRLRKKSREYLARKGKINTLY